MCVQLFDIKTVLCECLTIVLGAIGFTVFSKERQNTAWYLQLQPVNFESSLLVSFLCVDMCVCVYVCVHAYHVWMCVCVCVCLSLMF